jgi:hypothetical protein
MAIRAVTLHDLQALGIPLCPQCAEQYTAPCAVVVLEKDAFDTWHITLPRYSTEGGGVLYKVSRCCWEELTWQGRLLPARASPSGIGFRAPWAHGQYAWRSIIVVGPRALVDGEFMSALLRRYPVLQHHPLTMQLLLKTCNLLELEAEIALWQLSK